MLSRTLRSWLVAAQAKPNPRRVPRQRKMAVEQLEERQLLTAAAAPLPNALLLDFDTAKSPLTPDYTGVQPVRYSEARGFGWQTTTGLTAIDRGSSDPLTRDFHRGKANTFLVDVPNGTYQVTALLGDPANPMDRVSIKAEDRLVASNLSGATGKSVESTFQVEVTDGQMNLSFSDRGGRNPYFTLAALNIAALNTTAVSAAPTANAGADFSAAEGQSLRFDGTATGSGLSYLWSFGDGSSAEGTLSPEHTYQDNGTYTATLTVTDDQGNQAVDTLTVAVANAAPLVSLAGGFAGQAGVPLGFTATATDPGTADQGSLSYGWDFGDGQTSTLESPTHVYATEGAYTVTLTVTDKDNGSTTGQSQTLIEPASPLPALSIDAGADQNADEGQPVAFAGQVSGADLRATRLSYLWDFGDGAQSSGTLNPSHSYGDNGAYTVTLTVTDDQGSQAVDTLTVLVATVAPAAALPASFSGQVNEALTFTPAVSDPGQADQAAGFTYAWNFGDGSQSSGASATHSYAGAGTYSVTVTVTDKDGAAAVASSTVTVTAPTPASAPFTDDFIVTPFGDRIPNFGAHPTISSAASGAWSNPSTWSLGRLPVAGDVVSILGGNTVSYDLVSDAAIKTVVIQSGGHLVFRTDVNTRLVATNILVLEGGELQIGTEANPVNAAVKAEVIFANVPLDLASDPSQYGNGLIGLGKVTMHGAYRSSSFERLAVEPRAGDLTLTLANPVSGWRVGDRLSLPDSRALGYLAQALWDPEWETATLAGISADGRVLTLTSPLQFAHPGAGDGGELTFLPHVANVTRNVVVKSQSAAGTRGHALFTYRADVDIRQTAFFSMGRTTSADVDDTTYDDTGAVTHIGTNQSGRHSVNFRHLIGPAVTPANGFQYTFIGNVVQCQLPDHIFKWGITIEDSHYGLIQGNVLQNWVGGLATVTGSESYNVIEGNLVMRSKQGDHFWLNGTRNYFRNNVGASAKTGNVYYVPINLDSDRMFSVPAYRGADPTQPGQAEQFLWIRSTFLEFTNNEEYGSMSGMYFDHRHGGAAQGGHLVSGLKAWGIANTVIGGYDTDGLIIDGLVTRALPEGLAVYAYTNVTVQNSDIRGALVGIHQYGASNLTVTNTYVQAATGVLITKSLVAFAVWDTVPADYERWTVIQDVRFDAIPGAEFHSIVMDYRGSRMADLKHTVRVINYQQQAGNNFRVYFLEQAADALAPFVGDNPEDPIFGRSGAPVAGLTNQQAWELYGIAFAGEIAPATANATTRPEITGLTSP